MEKQEVSQQNRLRRKESRDRNPTELKLGREQLMTAVASWKEEKPKETGVCWWKSPDMQSAGYWLV